MTLEEKLAQLVGYWVDQGGEVVAPLAGEMATSTKYDEATQHGLGHLTRVYGTRPVDPVERAEWLWAEQRRLTGETRLGIPAIVHEECLTGLAAWKAATFPTPLAWGAAFDPALVQEMGRLIGGSMKQLGIHQGLAPVLDVIRDPRWGRVDECIAEDPYVVGTIGTAYVTGLQSAGVHATLKHFVGYSATQAGRNHAPVHAGSREINDVFLPPFEMAVLDGGVRSVMNSYAEIDGAPVGATPEYLTEILRDRWGFDGVVVSDYFSVAFLQLMHAVAADRGEAAELALIAGIDVELPTGDAFLAPLAERVRAGLTDEALIDRAVLRVLSQKEDLGLLDETFTMAPTEIDLDSPEHRRVARVLAEESLILLTNDGVLPLLGTGDRGPGTIAVLGPNADSTEALMGCYSFVNHVLAHHPDVPADLTMPTVLEALQQEFPSAEVVWAQGCEVEGSDASAIAAAVETARAADVAVVVVGDRAGLFGRGTVGEGNDAESLELPGVQRELVEALVATGTPVVMVLMTGRPYAVAWAVDGPHAPAAVLQAFFPGEEGGVAIASVLSGAVSPTGHLPVSLPRSAGAQPYSYLHPILGGPSDVTSVDSTPVLPFGHGLSYTTFDRTGLVADAEVAAGGTFSASVRIRNTGERAGTDLVQLYARDVHASVTRPVAQLLGYHRVTLEPGEEVVVRFAVPTARLAFTGLRHERIVEPGQVDLWVGASCADKQTLAQITITSAVHRVTVADARLVQSQIERVTELTRGTAAVPV
ncbi:MULTISPECIES: beta-glucosidase [unclassified Cryobacterium]|uniref:beta-xylosidase/alpha-l-arabinosidase n=1 Tax=unclassified Cryobacterium TaxID=2649013 RepID=UPI00106A889F|nr:MULTISPECIES: glycoside hydrolase family 3 N-terminal domain-containing protein [unclassified Cryobacterium]TFC51957.1 glycosyl hydrolase [Cryobacterium sp. TMB3-1-2]TFC68744.1 glycosyl hydrolase [Cryobacterium sp. TMB3-15]TFC74721.1 glycosyl hydrolase [Cryobacterium sp. TMB3-10]TFD46599.1 glycosyl hydrolase [Cryobacterium sp. TMB3-12]